MIEISHEMFKVKVGVVEESRINIFQTEIFQTDLLCSDRRFS